MTDQTELKPCPFCGGNATKDAHWNHFSKFKRSTVECNNDHCLAVCVVEKPTEAEAIAAWNQRPDQPTPTSADQTEPTDADIAEARNRAFAIEGTLDDPRFADRIAHARTIAQLRAANERADRAEEQLRVAREALEQTKSIIEDEAYKVTAGQQPCKHTAALNEVHATISQALAQMEAK
jgi:hypothetical protein